MNEDFEVIGKIEAIETIAIGSRIRELRRLYKLFGRARWRKPKGIVVVAFSDGTIQRVELHWYEAHGLVKKEMKIKAILD